MTPSLPALYDAVEHTWPPARRITAGPWMLRVGLGGGKRVSAATAVADVSVSDLAQAEIGMVELGQSPLFMVREGEGELDEILADAGYAIVDPVTLYTLPIGRLTDVPLPRVTAFCIWDPLAIMREIWAEGGIGPARLDVMARAQTKTAILARWKEKPAGTAFVAVHDGVAMVHAVEVLPHQRRMGVAQWIMRAAALWAAQHGAKQIAVLCVTENLPANALYQSLGFSPAGRYHYRNKPQGEDKPNGS
ncbi:MAG: GNAT family N-acetyltransferase [Pseudomonadota bacterium]